MNHWIPPIAEGKAIFNFFRLAIFFAFTAFSTPSAIAQDIGIQFKSMKVGTTAHYVDHLGRNFQYTYKGKFGRDYMIQVTGSRTNSRYYNSRGLHVRSHWIDYDIRFRPFFCNRKLGKCKFRLDTPNTKFAGAWNGNLYKTSKGYAFEMTSVSKGVSDRNATYFFKFGKYNFLSEYVVGNQWFRLVKITEPK